MANQRRQDLEEAQLQLKEAKIVSHTIAAATAKICEDRLLAPNGSNFAQWTWDLRELGGIYLNSKEFFKKVNLNSVLKKIGKAIFLSSLHPSLVYDAQNVLTCSGMFEYVEKKFKMVSCAAQVHELQNLQLSVISRPCIEASQSSQQVENAEGEHG
jgi:hypothetical protein